MERSATIQHSDSESRASAPFFSIGITTYNRPDLLKQTLDSISAQTFSDFEAIVGNDYAEEPLSAELLGITDPRIRFENYPENLGEANNMNELLARSRGRYFTWQNDDDLYAPTFLEEVYASLVKFDAPTCVFTSYDLFEGVDYPEPIDVVAGTGAVFSGREFLRRYLSGKLLAIGCTGVYSREYLTQVGGIELLGDFHRPLYTEYLYLIRAGLEERVVHIDQPLIRYRTHEGSWGGTTADLPLYTEVGGNLLSKSINILKMPVLRADFRKNVTALLKFLVSDFFLRCRIDCRLLCRLRALPYFFFLKSKLTPLKGSKLYWQALIAWGRAGMTLAWSMATQFNLKSLFVRQSRRAG